VSLHRSGQVSGRQFRPAADHQTEQLISADALPAAPATRAAGAGDHAVNDRPRAHTGDMGRIIGTILGAILAIWLAVKAAGGIVATLKTFLLIGLIAMAVFIVVWLVARRPRRS
jgi:predicted lipid-binding transport protein (Tim44 family)